MQELEKILEEMREASVFAKNHDGCVAECVTIGMVERILRKHMNDGWIPVEERMPKEHPSIFANLKGTAAWNNAMFENLSDEVNITIENEKGEVRTAHAYTVDGVWKSDFLRLYPRCCVIAWRPLPEPYRPERRVGE